MAREQQARLGAFVPDLRAVAVVEALALGSPRVETGHVLLGLRALGGPSAHALAAAGVGLPDLRRAVERTLSTGRPPVAPVDRAVRAVHREHAYTMPIDPITLISLDRVALQRTDTDLLGLLLDDDVVRDLLEDVGASIDDVVGQSALSPPIGPGAAPPRSPASAELGNGWLSAAHSHLLVPRIDQVWQLLSDPLRRPEWDPSCREIAVAGGIEQVTDSSGTVTDHVVAESREHESITWRWPPPAAAAGRPRARELQIRLSARGDRTMADLSMLIRGRRLVAALGGPAFRRLMRGQLRVLAQGINQAAE